jgi:hypothetical protein
LKFDICENFHTIFVQESEEDSSGRAEKADFKERWNSSRRNLVQQKPGVKKFSLFSLRAGVGEK